MLTTFEQLARDLSLALRQIRRNPGFSAIAIATLALGIGANTAMFSAVDAVLIRPLPYADAGRLVMVWDDNSRVGPVPENSFPRPPSGSSGGATTRCSRTSPPASPETPRSRATASPKNSRPARSPPISGASSAHDRCLDASSRKTKMRAAFGSSSSATDSGSGASAASPDVVGRTITLNDRPYEVIGVMPREFYFMPARDIDIWMPTSFSPAMLRNWGWHDVHCVARLKPGVTLRSGAGRDGGVEPAGVGATLEPCRVRRW